MAVVPMQAAARSGTGLGAPGCPPDCSTASAATGTTAGPAPGTTAQELSEFPVRAPVISVLEPKRSPKPHASMMTLAGAEMDLTVNDAER